MKVKNEAYLRSPLLRQTIKNSSVTNEPLWHAAVPSITYIWTHKPHQGRRRHKNRVKSKSRRFHVSSIASRFNEVDFRDTSKSMEIRPCSRSTTSPYETCSSKHIFTESESTTINDGQRNCELSGSTWSQRSQLLVDRKPSLYASRSDSGLRRARTTQYVRAIRSQKRFGIRYSANSQITVGTLSSLEVNKSLQLSIGRDLLSDSSIPKRRVTFSNYVSENSASDTRSRISTAMNDDDPGDAGSQRNRLSSCDFLTDDEEISSLQTDLSCLFSSLIFDESKSSFLSLTDSRESAGSEKSETSLKKKCSERIFYVNSSYSNESSSNLVSLSKICPNDRYPEDGNNQRDCEVVTKANESYEKMTREIVPDMKILREITNDSTYRQSIACITIELKDISSAVQEVFIGSGNDLNEQKHHESFSKNHISTDTNDLVAIRAVPSLVPIGDLSMNDDGTKNAKLSIDEILGLLPRAKDQIDAAFFLKELSKVGTQTFGNNFSARAIDDSPRTRGTSEIMRNLSTRENRLDWLRIDAETFGECESVLVEMEDLDDCFEDKNPILEVTSSLKIRDNLREPRESLLVNFAGISKHSELVQTSLSHFHNEFSECSVVDKCCVICGRKKIDNSRYLRPVCRVKGGAPSSRLENDPWDSVLKKIPRHDSGNKSMPSGKLQSYEEPSETSNSDIPKNPMNEPARLDQEDTESIRESEDECFSITITDVEASITTAETNVVTSRDQSTSSLPEARLCSATSFGIAAIRGPRSQSAKTYFMRESVRTIEGTANRLLCVISETDTLMSMPPFLSKKPPDWFARRQMPPGRRWSRR